MTPDADHPIEDDGADRRSGSVLVVDDDPINRVMLTNLLDAGGYRTMSAESGTEALATLEDEAVDAILLDVVMPGVDGVDVLESLKNSARHWRIPVIMVSAVDETDAIVRCLRLGAEDYVTKPFDPVLLRARLDACLARRRFGDLEGEYHRLVEEQAQELDRLHADRAGLEEGQEAVVGPGHRHLSIVVAGVSGLNALAAGLEPNEALRLAGTFSDVVGRAAVRHGATLERVGPQEATLLVGASGPLPDPAATALRLAQELVEEMEPLSEGWAEGFGGRWVVGAGVAAGDAIVGRIDAVPARLAVIGDVADAAHRRFRAALERGGGIVVEDGRAVGP